jgi:hypothetical protein
VGKRFAKLKAFAIFCAIVGPDEELMGGAIAATLDCRAEARVLSPKACFSRVTSRGRTMTARVAPLSILPFHWALPELTLRARSWSPVDKKLKSTKLG